MKQFLLAAVIVLAATAVHAQDDLVIKGTKKVTKKLTPQQVQDSLEKRFPDAKSVEYFKNTSAQAVANGWTVTEEDNLPSDADIEYYTISFKRSNIKYYGLYNRNGELLQCKVQEEVEQLPEAIVTSLKNVGKDHPGYKVVSKTYYKNQNYNKSKEYYEIVAEKGKERKTLIYAPDGTLVKVKG